MRDSRLIVECGAYKGAYGKATDQSREREEEHGNDGNHTRLGIQVIRWLLFR